MRVVFFTNTWKPQRGGVSTSIELFSSELKKRGHRVFIVAPEYMEHHEDPPWVFRVPAIKRFRGSAFSVPYPQLLNFRLLSGVKKLKPDVIHVHHPFLLGEVGLRIARKLGIPCVFTYHTLYHKYTHYLMPESDALKRVAIFASAFFANLCDAVVAPSWSVKEFLRKEGVRSEIVVIPTGVEEEFFSSEGGGRNYAGGVFRLAFAGRLEPEKNVEFLVRAVSLAMKRDSRIRLRVIGDGRERERLQKLARELGVNDRVEFAGEVGRERLKRLLSESHLFVFSSKTETQGLVVLEAMARGLPVVAVKGPGIVDVVRDGHNGFICSESEEIFGKKILAFLEHPLLLYGMSLSALRTAREFAISAMTERLESLYRLLLDRRKSEKKTAGRLSVDVISTLLEGKGYGRGSKKWNTLFRAARREIPLDGIYWWG